MPFDEEKLSSVLEGPNKPANKKRAEMRFVENDGVSQLVAWSGAFAFACLLVTSKFKRSKKIRSPKRSRDDDSNLDVVGFKENIDCETRKMEGLQLLLQSSSTDLTTRSCHTTSEMFVKYASIEGSDSDKNRTLMTTKLISEMNEDEKIVVIIYEEDQEYSDSDKSVENEVQKVVESSSFRAFEEEAIWLAEWTNESSTTSSSSSSSSSFLKKIEGDDKIIDIVIDDDDENGEDEEARIASFDVGEFGFSRLYSFVKIIFCRYT